MKKSKIIIALLLAVIMVLSVVAMVACDNGNGGKKGKAIELVLWAPSGAQNFYTSWANKWAKDYKDREGRNYKVKVSVMEEGEAKQWLLDAPQDCADVFLFADDQVADLANAGILATLGTGAIAQDVTARNSASSVASASYKRATDDEAKLYAYPMQADNTYFLYYNDLYFSAEDLETWEGIFTKLDTLNANAQGNTDRKKVAFDYDTAWYGASWFFTFGGEVSASNGISNFHEAEVGIKALQAAYEFTKRGGKNIAYIGPNDGVAKLKDPKNPDAEILDYEYVAMVAGTWLYSSEDPDNPTGLDQNEHIKMTVLPKITLNGETVPMKPFIGCKLIGVNAQCDYLEASHSLANYLTSEAVQKDKALKLFAGPSNLNAMADPAIAELPTVKVVAEQAKNASPQIDLPVGFWDVVGKVISAVRVDAANVKDYFGTDGQPIRGVDGIDKLLKNLEIEMWGSIGD